MNKPHQESLAALDPLTIKSPLEFAVGTSEGLARKADHNKNESLYFFVIALTASLISPAFVMLGTGEVWGKIIPSLLSFAAVGSTTWLQLRKPQSLWSIYRDCQRKLEDDINRFRYQLAPYNINEPERGKALADATCLIAMEAHQRWLTHVPTPEVLSQKPSATSSSGSNSG